ncbi:helix-turn-helix domain-containing protein [Apilactobacillus kunkeei]|uniref:helix-turn-helix domain-containing protein n=1 Tax=Apilactobacillus kunkeei TaxID=148814 RepID=UPI001126F4CC|nr:helix-turn-helix domain-containing protein [Apilactobacillus kunkeei]TPR52923.1 DNA-binding protein [Apilactobacillus kunkeei]
MKRTVKEMADAVNVSLSRMYRYIEKNKIEPVNKSEKTKKYSEDAQSTIFQYFTGNDDVHIKNDSKENENSENTDKTTANTTENELIELLKQEITNKNNEITTLHRLLDQQQQLDLANTKLISKYRDEDEQENENNNNRHSHDNSKSENNTRYDKQQSQSWWHLW